MAKKEEASGGFDFSTILEDGVGGVFSGEKIEQLVGEAKRFAKEHPVEAAGAAVLGAAVLYGLLGTKAGRHLVKTSASLAIPVVTGWVAKNMDSLV